MKKLAKYILTMSFWKSHFCSVKKNHAKSKTDFQNIIYNPKLILYNTKNYLNLHKSGFLLYRYGPPYFGIFNLRYVNLNLYKSSKFLKVKKKNSAFPLIFQLRAVIMNKNTLKGD